MENETKINEREKCLDTAKETVCKNRENEYGKPEYTFDLIANLWTDYLNTDITANDVCMMMCLLKIARVKRGTYREDSYMDIAGYAACGMEVAKDEF